MIIRVPNFSTFQLINSSTTLRPFDLSTFRLFDYLYYTNGTKLRKEVYGEGGHLLSVTDYDGDFVWQDGEPAYVLTGEGRLVYNDAQNTWQWEYYLKDHLGNVRIAFRPGSAGRPEVLQETHYYPFGMTIATLSHTLPAQPSPNLYRYNGKEFQPDNDLDWYDYGARYYDPGIGRFFCLDPIADKFNWVSSYNYAENDPVGSIDLYGLQKLKIGLKFTMTTGKVGFKFNVFNLISGGGSVYVGGGAYSSYQIYLEIDTKTGKPKLGASYTQSVVSKGNSLDYGPYHGGEIEEKKTVTDFNTTDGITKKDNKIYTKRETGGFGPVRTEETEVGTTAKTNLGLKIEVNALMIGVEIGTTVEYTKSTKTDRDTGKTKNKTGNNSTLELKKEENEE